MCNARAILTSEPTRLHANNGPCAQTPVGKQRAHVFAQVRRSISSLRLVALYCCAARSQPSKDCQRCMQQPLPHLSKVSPCLRVRRDTLCLIHPRYPSSCSSTFLYIAGRNPILVIAIHGSYLVWYTRITMTHHTSRTRTRYSCVESGYVVRARRTAHGTVTMPFPTWRDPPLPEGIPCG